MSMKKKLFTKALSVLLCLSLLVSLVPAAALAATPFTVQVNGRLVDGTPIIVGRQQLVPATVLAELTLTVAHRPVFTAAVPATKTPARIDGRLPDGRAYSISMGARTATVDGRAVRLERPAQLRGGGATPTIANVFLPLSFIRDVVGASATVDTANRIVRIARTPVAARSRVVPGVPRAMRIAAGGATFPFPLYATLTAEYARVSSPAIQIDYASIGSGAGRRSLIAGTLAFAGTDAFFAGAAGTEDAPFIYVPTMLGAVAVAYNIPRVPTGLRLTPAVLRRIVAGAGGTGAIAGITDWNHPDIRALQIAEVAAALPTYPASLPIVVVRRSDSSGTTDIFTRYLQATNIAEVGTAVYDDRFITGGTFAQGSASPAWPNSIGARGNEGVAAEVRRLPGAIGYVELSNALIAGLDVVHMLHRGTLSPAATAGSTFIAPSVLSTNAAAAGLTAAQVMGLNGGRPTMGPLISVTAAGAYPIAGLTWIVLRRDQDDLTRARAILDFLHWALVDAVPGGVIDNGAVRIFAGNLHYAPLAVGLTDAIAAQLRLVTHRGAVIRGTAVRP